jgi:hypothetical protein
MNDVTVAAAAAWLLMHVHVLCTLQVLVLRVINAAGAA